MAKLKKVGIFILVVLIIAFIYLFSRENNVKIYLQIANPSENIDLTVKVGSKQIFKDSLRYHPYEAVIIEENLKFGIYTISVSSNKARVRDEGEIFVFYNQYIVVQYYPKSEINEKGFDIDNMFTPFRFE